MNKLLRYPWFLPTVIFAILVLAAANMHPLWGDEAETALFARNIVKFSLPKGWDGVNIMGITNAAVLNKDLINHTSPWAQYYLVAASFKLFGESSFTARLPSIIISFFTIPLIYILANKLTKNKKIAFLTTVFSSLSVQYILFAYQARYYILTCLSGLLFFYAAYSLHHSNWKTKLLFIISGVIFFYANYVSFFSFYLATFFSLLFYQILQRESLRKLCQKTAQFVILSIFIALLTVPWIILLKPMQTRGIFISYPLKEFFLNFGYFLHEGLKDPFNFSNVFPYGFYFLFVFILTIYLKRREIKSIKLILFLASISFFFLINMTMITTLTYVDTLFVNARYTTVIIPFLILLAATLVYETIKLQKWLGFMVIFLYLFTNIFTFNKPRSDFLNLLNEMVHSYATPDIMVAQYLKSHAAAGDTAFVNLDRDHESLIFQLNKKIRFINRVSLVNTRIFPKNRAIIPRYIYDFRGEPDWVIFYSRRIEPGDFMTFDLRPLPPEVNLSDDYNLTILPIFFSDLSRPEIDVHSFTKIEPSYDDQIFIYQKKAKNE